jgi:hypothetical protein
MSRKLSLSVNHFSGMILSSSTHYNLMIKELPGMNVDIGQSLTQRAEKPPANGIFTRG